MSYPTRAAVVRFLRVVFYAAVVAGVGAASQAFAGLEFPVWIQTGVLAALVALDKYVRAKQAE